MSDIVPDRPLKDHGLDSLIAVELRASLERESGIPFSTMELLAGRTLRELAIRYAGAGR